jgi:hypothetical protein
MGGSFRSFSLLASPLLSRSFRTPACSKTPAIVEDHLTGRCSISFWAKNVGSGFVSTARGVSAKEGEPGVVIRSKDTINEWRQFECTHTIPPNMWLRFNVNVVQPGTFWIDDIQIVRVNDTAK